MLPSEEIVYALKNDAALANITGDRVYFLAPPIEPIYPLLVYSEASDTAAWFADNEEQAAEIAWNVSVLNTGSTTAIANRVVAVMAGLGYYRDVKHDLVDSGVYAKVMRFKTTKEVQNG